MTTSLTVECEVHFARKARGRKVLEVGVITEPPLVPGRVPRVTKWMALAIRCDEYQGRTARSKAMPNGKTNSRIR